MGTVAYGAPASAYGSCGKVVPNTLLKVIDLESGEALGAGERGEICIQGPQVMVGYSNNDKATAETLKGGWLHTGDIGFYDKEENIFIVDRLKELIKVKGFQVAPAELEDVIRSIPDVADVGVIGIPCSRNGEVPRAYVVKAAGSGLNEEAVANQVAKRLSKNKRLLGGVEFVEIIPKSPAGKILRKELKSQFFMKTIPTSFD